jgi:hypothetical protein
MIGLRIGAEELAELEAGAPCVVVAPGFAPPEAPPLVPLLLVDGVLARPGSRSRAVPVPRGFRPLAVLGPADGAARLLPLLPAGVPVLASAGALLAPLAAALAAAEAGRAAAVVERDRLRRALGAEPALPRLRLEAPPGAGQPLAPPVTRPLGCPAEGIATVELHLAAPGTAPLRARLLAGGRVVGSWHLPAGILRGGWLSLDLPEPAPPGPEEAVLELVGEAGAMLSPCGAGLALRVLVAPPGWSVLPRHFDWSATGLPNLAAGLPLPLPESLLAAATAEGGRVAVVAAGAEPGRLLLELAAHAEAVLRLPLIQPGPADLLRLVLARRDGAGGVAGEVTLLGEESAASGWRDLPDGGELAIALPLPPGPQVRVTIALRETGGRPQVVEVARLALMSGAAGEPRRAPAVAGREHPTDRPVVLPRMPSARGPAQPQPRLPDAGPGSMPRHLAAPLVALPVGASLGEVRLHQHLVNTDGTYRHLDMAATGLVAGGGLWPQLRVKLFERRGIVGMEFRDMKGWPTMFDAWPGARADGYGSFWRIETEATASALGELSTAHDRAFLAALLEVLPELATRAATVADLPQAGIAAWAERGSLMASAVSNARGAGG